MTAARAHSSSRGAVLAEVVLALGTNLGDRWAIMRSAVKTLEDAPELEVTAVSDVVATHPVGGPEQPDYLNAIVLTQTDLAPVDVLALCHRIEAAHERERSVRWGPRTLDIDLITYSRNAIPFHSDDPNLTLPHPRAAHRAFVLVPWSLVAPTATLDPGTGPVAIRELAELAPDRSGVRPAGPLREEAR
ncbi:MAG: 2-amino-4-hydroxy-6-hydroxymethyldihydropteridine diphosphokinase [Actinomycetota bacterium]